jgi:phosphohistidine phosphatase
MAPTSARRTVWLLRHAKTVTDPPPGGSDFDRVLAPRGRRDSNALGRMFAGKGEGLGRALSKTPRPALALVSPAARTRATAELVLADVAEPPERRYEHDLYGADADEVVDALQQLPDDVRAVMVVGHNPTAHTLSRALLSPRDEKGLELTMRQGFPTCALGVYSFKTGSWKDVDRGGATLVALMVPPFG